MTEGSPACPRCGGPLTRRSAAPLLLAPVVLGVLSFLLVRHGGAWMTGTEMLVLVTAAFVAFIAALGGLARAWLRERCARCEAGSAGAP